MSRTSSRPSDRSPRQSSPRMSATQRRACIVVACCVAAIALCFVLSWIVVPGLFREPDIDYDPGLYPLDTTLSAILPQGAESSDYMSGTVFVGDDHIASMQAQNLLTLDQFAGAKGLSLTTLLRDTCVFFADDPAAYTVPQALAKMKPRRVVLAVGSNDVSGNYSSAQDFVAGYRQVVSAIRQAYEYCDIIVTALPPVRSNAANSGTRQTAIDEYNQALALMCQSDGLPFLNTTEALKDKSGFAQDTYFDNASGTYTVSGGNALLMYFRQHPYATADRRPDTADIPRRAAQPADGSAPSPTPEGIAATYTVEDSARGTLTTSNTEGLTPGAVTTDAAKLEYNVPERTTITVTAKPKAGWMFLKWSDGVTQNPRTDNILSELSVVAIFGQPTLKMYWNGSGCDNAQVVNLIKAGESVPLTVRITLNGVEDSTLLNKVEWVVNEQTVAHGGSYTFAPNQPGNYDIIAGLVLDGTSDENVISTYITAEVAAPPPTQAPPTQAPPVISITASSTSATIGGGQPIMLTASTQNFSGTPTIKWSCAQIPTATWNPEGLSVQFPIPETPGDYVITATSGGVTSNAITIKINAPMDQ